jgi:hypothetical protein
MLALPVPPIFTLSPDRTLANSFFLAVATLPSVTRPLSPSIANRLVPAAVVVIEIRGLRTVSATVLAPAASKPRPWSVMPLMSFVLTTAGCVADTSTS